MDPESGAYNLAIAKRLRGTLDVVAMERALSELVRRHESLRTTFSLIDDVPHQVIRRPQPVRLALTDLAGVDEQQERAEALVHEEVGRGFDLEIGPLLRASLLRLGADEHIFILTLHHIVVDGWSMPQLVLDVGVAEFIG